MHRVESELENHSGSLSLLVHETYLEPNECFPRHTPKYYSHANNKLTLVPDKFDLTKSLDHPRHARPLFTSDNTDCPFTVDTPAFESFHPLFYDLFHEPVAPVISSSHSKFSCTGIGDNQKHVGGVSQSRYKIDESLRYGLFHPKSLNNQRGDFLSWQPQKISLLLIHPNC